MQQKESRVHNKLKDPETQEHWAPLWVAAIKCWEMDEPAAAAFSIWFSAFEFRCL